MNSQWITFLQSRNGAIGDDGRVRFPSGGPLPECLICDLSYLGLICFSGRDAPDLLQGQFTNDIRELKAESSQLAACCTPKGRMLANGRLFRREDEIFLQLALDTQEPLTRRLSMFKLRSQVEIKDAGNRLVRIGLAGSCAPELLEEQFPELPAETDSVAQYKGLTLIRVGGTRPRFQIVGEAAEVAALWDRLAEKATPANSDYWSLLDIRAGLPAIQAATAEAFIPQMTNMQRINGISFSKGCYCGQEVVTRTQHRGTLKRRMYLAHVGGDRRPAPGDELYSPSAEHDQSAGTVINAEPAPEGGYDLLAVIQTPCRQAEDVRLGNAGGEKLEFCELPYEVED